jgi:glycine oxidase
VDVTSARSELASPAARSRRQATDVVIAGGGLIGLGIAWRAAQRGLEVSVVDPSFGQGASYGAAGMLAPVSEATYGEERLLRLGQASLSLYPSFVDELVAASGVPVRLRTTGTLQVGFDADDMAALSQLQAFHEKLGLPVARLTASDARRREPSLTPRIRGGIHVPSDHSVDGRQLHAALRAACAAGGVTLVEATATALIVESGRCVGLSLADGSPVRAGTVVNALGPWSPTLPGTPYLPVRPVGGQILRLRGPAVLEGTVRGLVRGHSVYLVPLGEDELIIGATVEEKGFASQVTAGGVYELLRDATEVAPGISELELTETVVRFRPGSPDNAPILGLCVVPGLVLATGHYRNGVLLTPITADAIATLLADGDLPEVADGFDLERFSGDRAD